MHLMSPSFEEKFLTHPLSDSKCVFAGFGIPPTMKASSSHQGTTHSWRHVLAPQLAWALEIFSHGRSMPLSGEN
jgi:hypothetical protein